MISITFKEYISKAEQARLLKVLRQTWSSDGFVDDVYASKCSRAWSKAKFKLR